MTLSELLKQSAEKFPNRAALLFRDQRWNYLELYEISMRVAAGLKSKGIQPGDRVILLLKNSPEFAFTVFALSHLGAIAVPINFLLKPEEILFICSDTGAVAVVTQSAFLETVQIVQTKYSGLRTVIAASDEISNDPQMVPYSSLMNAEHKIEETKISDDRTILILYTSGTSGKPKGAMLSHKNLTSNAESCVKALELTSKDRFICILPMFHVFAWTTNILVPILLGAPITIIESIRPPKPWLKLMSKNKITIFSAIPQIYLHLAAQAEGIKKWFLRWLFFGRVRFCVSGAAPLPVETLTEFETKMKIPILEGYGLTETAPVVCVNTLKARKAGSVGKPIPGVEIKIIDENENAVPQGNEGEICVRGPNVISGYYRLPDETKKAFTRDGWFKTGDIGAFDTDGFLLIKDRIKDMIIVKGLKIFSIQVEEALLAHPSVAEAAVVGIPNSSGDETIKAFVVLKDGASTGKLELLKFCQEKLPPYKRPKEIEIRTELPKNALQKVLKRELRKG